MTEPAAICTLCGTDLSARQPILTTREPGCYCWTSVGHTPDEARLEFHQRGHIAVAPHAISLRFNLPDLAKKFGL